MKESTKSTDYGDNYGDNEKLTFLGYLKRNLVRPNCIEIANCIENKQNQFVSTIFLKRFSFLLF